LAETDKGTNSKTQVEKPRAKLVRSVWGISYIKRKFHERKAKYEAEIPTDKAARRTATATVWIAVFTVLLAIVGAITVHEVIEGGTDTHLLAVATDQLAKNADITLKNQEAAFQAEQRAWVGVLDAVPIAFSETVPWSVTVIFFNSGRTPARNVKISIMYTTSSVPIAEPSQEQIDQLQFRPVQSIAPQGKFNLSVGAAPGPQPMTDFQRRGTTVLLSQYKEIKDSKLLLYYFGRLSYEDSSGKERETRFCIYLSNPTTKAAGFCEGFNDLN
jgi:hypothetical protein